MTERAAGKIRYPRQSIDLRFVELLPPELRALESLGWPGHQEYFARPRYILGMESRIDLH